MTGYETAKFWSRVQYLGDDQCWLWTGAISRDGHGDLKLDGRHYKPHRLAYELAVGEIPDDMLVRHRCDTPACCNPTHLQLGTHADNVADRVERGRSAVGEQNGRAKLTVQNVVEILQRLDQGESRRSIAKLFAVHPRVISQIEDGTTWQAVIRRHRAGTL